MRFVRAVGLVFIAVVLGLGAVAFVLFDPLPGRHGHLPLSEMIASTAKVPDPAGPGEEPVLATDPAWEANLALLYQPTLVVSGFDRNWPMSLGSILEARWHGHGPCLYVNGHCTLRDPTTRTLAGPSTRSEYIRFPAPVDNVQDTFDSVASQLGVSYSELRRWPHGMAQLDPFRSAEIYFYYLARTRRSSYPGIPAGMIALEYWFLYPLNYFPLVRIPVEAIRHPVSSTIGNTDYHQGDLEHVAVILNPRTLQPLYLWMARHNGEGVAYGWHARALQRTGDHVVVYAALGSHASYAECGIQRRSKTYELINDYVVCIPHETYAFLPATTALVDLAHTPWGCWRGHLGQAGRGLYGGQVSFAPYETAGPPSPLRQQENHGVACPVRQPSPPPGVIASEEFPQSSSKARHTI